MEKKDVDTRVGTGTTTAAEDKWGAVSAQTTSEATQTLSKNFSKIDTNGNGYLVLDELDQFVNKNKYSLSAKERDAVKFFRNYQDQFQNESNDEFFFEDGGVTKADLTAFSKNALSNFDHEGRVREAADALLHYNTEWSLKYAKDFIEFADTLPPTEQRAIVQRLEKVSAHNATNEIVFYRNHYALRYADTFSAVIGDKNGDGKTEVIEAELKARAGCQCKQCVGDNTRIHDLLK